MYLGRRSNDYDGGVTHEYMVAVNGGIAALDSRSGTAATAIAWAADRVLAVGSDDVVRAISRGDSTFLDLGGSIATPLPDDLARATAVVAGQSASRSARHDIGRLLVDAGLLQQGAELEPGSVADLAFWSGPDAAIDPDNEQAQQLVAIVRAGRFTEGHPRRGPFPAPPIQAGK
jgi:hypothetical protein